MLTNRWYMYPVMAYDVFRRPFFGAHLCMWSWQFHLKQHPVVIACSVIQYVLFVKHVIQLLQDFH